VKNINKALFMLISTTEYFVLSIQIRFLAINFQSRFRSFSMKMDERNPYYFSCFKWCSGAWVGVSTLLACRLLQTEWISATQGRCGRAAFLFSAIAVGKQAGRN